MAVLDRENFLTRLKGFLGERNDDEVIEFYSDVSDTYDDFDRRVSESGDWEQKYKDNDKMWRDKYIARFSGKQEDAEDPDPEEGFKKMEYEDLFEEEKED